MDLIGEAIRDVEQTRWGGEEQGKQDRISKTQRPTDRVEEKNTCNNRMAWQEPKMAWQWVETLVEIRGTLADIRGTTN